MPRRHLTHPRRCELHPALGALSWLGVSQSAIAKALRDSSGRSVSQGTVSLWYLCAKPVPEEFHVPLWNMTRDEAARAAALAERALILRPDLHRDRTFQLHFRCVRRAAALVFGPGRFAEGELPEPIPAPSNKYRERTA